MYIGAFKSDLDKKDTYAMLVLFFQSVQQMANNKIGGWGIEYGFTDNTNQEFITAYSNGKLSVRAHSVDGDHHHSVKAVK